MFYFVYGGNFMWHFWLIAAGACFVLEIITVGFLMFWFGIGALIAMLVSLIVDNIIIQITVFIISSTLLLLFTKPLLRLTSAVQKREP